MIGFMLGVCLSLTIVMIGAEIDPTAANLQGMLLPVNVEACRLAYRRKEDMKPDRDIEKGYPLPEFIEKLRRFADAPEKGHRFEIQIAGERISVPVRATYNIEHEREGGEEEIDGAAGRPTRSSIARLT